MLTNWETLISNEMEVNNDSWDDLVKSTLSKKALKVEFNADAYGTAEGEPFTLWTKEYVYFPVVYDGMEWCGSVPRHPCKEKTHHQGGQ